MTYSHRETLMSDVDQDNPLVKAPYIPRHERPLWIWAPETGAFVWANREAVKFWGASSLEQLQSKPVDHHHPAWLAVKKEDPSGWPSEGTDLNLHFPQNGKSYDFVAKCRCGHLHAREAIIVELTGKGMRDEKESAEQLDIFSQEQVSAENLIAEDDVVPPAPSNSVSLKNQTTSRVQSDPIDEPTLIMRPPKESLDELARLIQEASQEKEADHRHEVGKEAKYQIVDTAPHEHIEAVSNVIEEKTQDEKTQNQVVDLIALAGVRDQDELETILDQGDGSFALINGQQLIYANEGFVSGFGYGTFKALKDDGLDWIFPGNGALFSQLIAKPQTEQQIKLDMRLRSGRKMKRELQLTAITLIKFADTFVLAQLMDDLDLNEMQPEKKVDDGGNNLPAIQDDQSISLLSTISHEIRTPLTVISGFAEIMDKQQFGPLENKKYQEYAHDIYESAQHALSLINDLLDLRKLQAGKWELNLRELDINELVRQQIHLLRGIAANQSLKLSSNLEENLPHIQGDELAIRQILINLISNAIKFCSEGGQVSVTTKLAENQLLELIIADNGVGMNKAELELAMAPFHQVTGNNDHKGGKEGAKALSGSGLGLPIAKALADASGMNFKIISEKGVGTKVVLGINL